MERSYCCCSSFISVSLNFPFLYAAALFSKRLPQNVQNAACGAYSESCFYWGAVTLIFRLVMSIVFTTIRTVPSTAALIQCLLCVAILALLLRQKPYRSASTYIFDIFCYAILIIQSIWWLSALYPNRWVLCPAQTTSIS